LINPGSPGQLVAGTIFERLESGASQRRSEMATTRAVATKSAPIMIPMSRAAAPPSLRPLGRQRAVSAGASGRCDGRSSGSLTGKSSDVGLRAAPGAPGRSSSATVEALLGMGPGGDDASGMGEAGTPGLEARPTASL